MSEDRFIRVKLPDMPRKGHYPRHEIYDEDGRTSGDLVFIGRHDDVRQVLMDNGPDDFRYSVAHYRIAGRRTSRGPDLLIGTEMGEQTGEARKRLQRILNRAWEHLAQNADAKSRIDCIAEDRLERTLQRVSGSGRIDLVRDFATETAYGISSEVFGIPGPPWLTELASGNPVQQTAYRTIAARLARHSERRTSRKPRIDDTSPVVGDFPCRSCRQPASAGRPEIARQDGRFGVHDAY